jgi:uncharacterized protein YjbI with pentapeptide repeats
MRSDSRAPSGGLRESPLNVRLCITGATIQRSQTHRVNRLNGVYRLRELATVILTVAVAFHITPCDSAARLPGIPCAIELPRKSSDWTKQEHWVWKEICNGRQADLRAYARVDPPSRQGDRRPGRELTQRFLETILLHEPYLSAIPRGGVKIAGARFPTEINLSNAKLTHELAITNSRFDSNLILRGLSTERELSIESDVIEGKVDMSGLQAKSLVLRGFTAHKEVELRGANIGGQLIMIDATIMDTLDMDGLQVAQHLFLRNASLATVVLRGARIGDQLDMRCVTVKRELDMDSLQVGRHVFMSDATLFKGAKLRGAKILGQLTMERAAVADVLDMADLQVGGSLFMRDIVLFERASLIYLAVGGNLDLSGGSFSSMNLSGAKVNQALRLGSRMRQRPEWEHGASLILRNASVRDLQDRLDCSDAEPRCQGSWPMVLELDGFMYENLSALDVNTQSDMAVRRAEWWADWLARQKEFSPQPYEQLAFVLQKLGQKDKAKDILYEAKDRERYKAQPLGKTWLTMQKWFIGYGYRIYYAWAWVLGFVVAGVVVLQLSGEGRRNNMPFGIAYSIDMLLPVIHLRDAHYKIDLDGWARYWFFFHKTMGYVLASFLIAGLSGLTK